MLSEFGGSFDFFLSVIGKNAKKKSANKSDAKSKKLEELSPIVALAAVTDGASHASVVELVSGEGLQSKLPLKVTGNVNTPINIPVLTPLDEQVGKEKVFSAVPSITMAENENSISISSNFKVMNASKKVNGGKLNSLDISMERLNSNDSGLMQPLASTECSNVVAVECSVASIAAANSKGNEVMAAIATPVNGDFSTVITLVNVAPIGTILENLHPSSSGNFPAATCSKGSGNVTLQPRVSIGVAGVNEAVVGSGKGGSAASVAVNLPAAPVAAQNYAGTSSATVLSPSKAPDDCSAAANGSGNVGKPSAVP